MTQPRILAVVALIAALVAGAAANREYLTLTYLGLKVEKRTIAEQRKLIEPFIHEFKPANGQPPFPAIIQFHGCAGYRPDFMEMWAKVATDRGFIVLAIDSAGPRGFDREISLDEVCAGKKLIGQERAGDIAAAFAYAAARPEIDPNRIIAAGWSHGAWSLMDYLALAARGANPPSIIDDVAAIDPAGVILFYPYCGEGAWSRLAPWKTKAPVIAFIAGSDSIVDGGQCRTQLQRLSKEGTNVELIDYPEADHVFDDAGLAGGEFAHYYSPADAADAAMRYARFINAIRDRSRAARAPSEKADAGFSISRRDQ